VPHPTLQDVQRDTSPNCVDAKCVACRFGRRERFFDTREFHDRLNVLPSRRPSPIPDSLAANTSTKFASGVSTADARAMATDMRTSVDFILKQPSLQFACHIRNVTPQAVSIPIVAGLPERINQLTTEQYERMRELNRSRVSISDRDQAGIILPSGNEKEASIEDVSTREVDRTERQVSEDPSAPSDEW
jgi:hypothetical protein